MKKAGKVKTPRPKSDFEEFVSAILAVPKDAIKKGEAKRLKRVSPKRKSRTT